MWESEKKPHKPRREISEIFKISASASASASASPSCKVERGSLGKDLEKTRERLGQGSAKTRRAAGQVRADLQAAAGPGLSIHFSTSPLGAPRDAYSRYK